jgi:hypothetical protein
VLPPETSYNVPSPTYNIKNENTSSFISVAYKLDLLMLNMSTRQWFYINTSQFRYYENIYKIKNIKFINFIKLRKSFDFMVCYS